MSRPQWTGSNPHDKRRRKDASARAATGYMSGRATPAAACRMRRPPIGLALWLCALGLLWQARAAHSATGDKSRAKCEEYARYVYADEDSPVLHARARTDRVSRCGVVEVPLVIGGVRAGEREFPHMAVLGYGKSARDPGLAWRCGGSLISESFVLTAAHCLQQSETPVQKVRLGAVDLLASDEDAVQERAVKRKHVHPGYRTPARYHDLALLELDAPVEPSAHVRPACLHTEPEVRERAAIATGFGKTSFDADEGSSTLMKVTLAVLANERCERFFRAERRSGALPAGLTRDVLCAGELSGGKDTCQGDSGGALQIALRAPYCMYGVLGVVSFGRFCGFANMPAIYTRVSAHLDWIESVVWP